MDRVIEYARPWIWPTHWQGLAIVLGVIVYVVIQNLKNEARWRRFQPTVINGCPAAWSLCFVRFLQIRRGLLYQRFFGSWLYRQWDI